MIYKEDSNTIIVKSEELYTSPTSETRRITDELIVRAREYMKNLPRNWLTTTNSCKAFVSCIGFLDDTSEARELGPTIASLLYWEYGCERAQYHTTSNCITVRIKLED